MADYTLKNIKDITNMAEKFELSPGLEARFARDELELTKLGVSYLGLAPNFRVPFGHHHNTQEEVYVLVSGSAKLKLDDEVIELKPFDAVRIHEDTMRNLEGGPEGAEVVLFGAPNAGSDDAQMEQGWWMD